MALAFPEEVLRKNIFCRSTECDAALIYVKHTPLKKLRRKSRRSFLELIQLDTNTHILSEIITTEVSRLSRSTKQLCEIIDRIQQQLKLEILGSITIDCHSGQLDPMTKAFLQMSGIFAELELSMIRARVRSEGSLLVYNPYLGR